MLKTLIIGWGNPLLGDDALGIRVAEKLKEMRLPDGVKVESCSSSPSTVIRKMLNCRKVIIIDSARIPNVEEGSPFRLKLEYFEGPYRLINPHSISLPALYKIYKALYPDKIPDEVIVIGMNVGSCFGENLSERTRARIEELVNLVLREVKGMEDERACHEGD